MSEETPFSGLDGRAHEVVTDLFGNLDKLSPTDRDTALKFAEIFTKADEATQKMLVERMQRVVNGETE